MPSFLKLVDQSRLKNYLGLSVAPGYEIRRPNQNSRDYAYIEVPILGFRGSDGEVSPEARRGSYVEVVPACTVNVRGTYRFEVHPNKKIYEFGMAEGMFYLEPEDGQITPSYRILLRKDIALQDLDFCIRIYMRD
jgi:hypothetical protein